MNLTRKKKMEIINSFELVRYQDPADYLHSLYSEFKKQLKLTHEDFSELLGLSRGNNQIRLTMKGQRKLSNKAAIKIADQLELTGASKQYFLKMVFLSNGKSQGEKDQLLSELLNLRSQLDSKLIDNKQLDYFCDWYNPVIREVLSLTDMEVTPQSIQQRLNFPLRLEQIKKSLTLLTEMGVIQFHEDTNTYSKTDRHLATESQMDSMLVVRYHQKMIEMGQESIFTIDENERSIEAVTLSLSQKKIATLREKIETIIQEAIRMEDEDEVHDAVYQLNLQLFPFTKPKERTD